MNVEQVRNDTPACKERIHLNNAGAALMPKQVVATLQNHINLEAQIGGYEAAEECHNEIQQFYDVAAQFLNCKPTQIAYTNNATDSYSRALSSIPFKENDVVLTTSNDYSSNQISFLSLRKRFDIRIVKVEDCNSGEVDLEDFENKLRKYRPKLVAVTHIPTNSGLVQPVSEIGELVKNTDTIYILDACQSLGQLQVDVNELHCDFLSGTMRKFLRGPRGGGILYVSQKALDLGLEPLLPDMRGADWVGEFEYIPQKTAKRFEDWEFAYALLLASKEAFKYTLNIGMKNIEERNTELAEYTRNRLSAIHGIRLMDLGSQKCNIITFHSEKGDPIQIKKYLRDRKINVSIAFSTSGVIDFQWKGVDWIVRVSPHYYNTVEEIDEFVEVMQSLI